MGDERFDKTLQVRMSQADWFLLQRLCDHHHVDSWSMMVRVLVRSAWDAVRDSGELGLGFEPGDGVEQRKGQGSRRRRKR
jgi:hypothetical protein